jgi:hydroxyethylthiazole kinase
MRRRQVNEKYSDVLVNAARAWAALRQSRPLVHHITNYVTMSEQAHATLAIGASPVMALSREEAGQMCAAASALLLNMGTPSPESIEAMLRALQVANSRTIPVVLDVVGLGATSFRDEIVHRILNGGHVTVLKGNYGEIMALSGQREAVRGVDSEYQAEDDITQTIRELAKEHRTTIIATGRLDYLGSSSCVYEVSGGSELLTHMTGSGCILGSILTAVLGAYGTSPSACLAALLAMKLASEKAAQDSAGMGTFRVRLFDALSALTQEDIASNAQRMRVVQP